jgi:hypothetical protein
MTRVEDLRHELQINGYKTTESAPSPGDVLLKKSRGGNILIEVENFNRDNIKNILSDLHFKTMVRDKNNGKVQFIIKV